MTKNLKITLLILFVFQLAIAFGFELAHDEAYYWVYSKNLAWGYFDHPPFVAIVIRLFSFLPGQELPVRIGFILLQFLALGLLFKLILKEFHLTITLLFFAFPLASYGGLLALPDMPLLFMTSVYIFCLRNYLEKDSLQNSLIMGLAIALLLYAKYHGILLVFFTLVSLPSLFKKKSFYLVAVTSIVLFFPHVWWQYQHDFATLRYHFFERPSARFSFIRSLEYLGMQAGLAGVFVGPVVWWICLTSKSLTGFERVMKISSLGIVLFFLISSFSKKVEANWMILLTPLLIYLSASNSCWKQRKFRILLLISFTFVVISRALLVTPPEWGGPRRLNEFHGWEKWSQEIKASCDPLPILANTYQIASKLSFYLKVPVHSLNLESRKNQFDFWAPEESYYQKSNVCFISNKSSFSGPSTQTPDGKSLMSFKELRLNDFLIKK